MNMIEKVARALARDMLTDLGKAAFDANPDYYNKSFSSSEHKRLEGQARAAIEAMRLPTEEMRKACIEARFNPKYKIDEPVTMTGTGQGDLTTIPFFENVWRDFYMDDRHNAMIDAALKE